MGWLRYDLAYDLLLAYCGLRPLGNRYSLEIARADVRRTRITGPSSPRRIQIMVDKVISAVISLSILLLFLAMAAAPAYFLSGEAYGAIYGVCFVWIIAGLVKWIFGRPPESKE